MIWETFYNFLNFLFELTSISAASRGRQQQNHSGDGQDVQRRASRRRRRCRRRRRRRRAHRSSGHHRARNYGATRSRFRTLYGGTTRATELSTGATRPANERTHATTVTRATNEPERANGRTDERANGLFNGRIDFEVRSPCPILSGRKYKKKKK